ncbi:MNNG and nitrosoguanidine resistance protein [Xylariomycetidae sp. FL2044]|nr:MNNG and nitrosoguanidine resistance protein [Xylariomycetidae sp. FL2044]
MRHTRPQPQRDPSVPDASDYVVAAAAPQQRPAKPARDSSSGYTYNNNDDGGGDARERGEVGRGGAHHDKKHHYGQRQSVGFWHPGMRKVRKEVMLGWLRTIIILMAFIMAVLSLYWGALYEVEANLSNLTVHVVDFDGKVSPYDDSATTPLVGPAVTSLAQQLADAPEPSLGYTIVPPARYGNDPMAVRRAVYEGEAWAAVVVNANATALLRAAVAQGNASYDPTGAVQIILLSARQESTVYNYVLPQLEAFGRQFAAAFGPRWSASVMADASLDRDALARAPAAVNPGVAPLQIDLRPFGPPVATPAVTIGLIYLIIVAFFSFSFFLPIHSKYITPNGHPPLHYWQLIIWRWLATITSYFFISLAYSLVSLAFQIPFWPAPASPVEVATMGATRYGRASFVVYWMLNFVGMAALGIACENVAMVVGQPWTALWLIFWVITNVSTAFYNLELAPDFYRWGVAWPLHHVVAASRQILFDLHGSVALHFGVLVAWVAVDTALFPLCCYFMRWKGERAARSAERAKDRYAVRVGDGKDGEKEFPKPQGEKPPKRKRGFMRGA